MTNSQKIIKYFAIAFAIFLIYTISSAIITSAGIIIKSFDKKPNEEISELKEIYSSDKINSLDIDLHATNLIIKIDEKVSIQTNNNYIKVKEELGVLKIEEDDNISTNKIISKLLKDTNIELDYVGLGKEALDKIRSKEKYDLILLDEVMDPLDGKTVMKKFKDIRDFNTKVILLTRNNEYEYNEEYLKYGFAGYLLKPINKDKLLEIIDKYL